MEIAATLWIYGLWSRRPTPTGSSTSRRTSHCQKFLSNPLQFLAD
jgi:hypothetical protein